MVWFLVLAVFSALILIHELGHFWMARRCGVVVDIFSFGFGPKLFSFKRGSTQYRISAVPFGGYIKMAGDDPTEPREGKPWEFLSQPVGKRLKIILGGPLLNYLLGFVLFSLVFYIGYPTLTAKVGAILGGYPAKDSGIMVNDKILAVDGKAVRYWDDVTEIIHSKTQGPVTLALLRDGREITVSVSPKVQELKDVLGQKSKIGLIGIGPSDETENVRYGFAASISLGFARLMKLTGITYHAFWRILTGGLSLKESVSGPIGIFKLTASAARLGIAYLFQVTAIITASLAIFNLLPFPVLDGGYIIFLILEKLRGKPVSGRTQEVVIQLGMAFLIALMVFVSYNDIIRLIRK